MQPTGNQERFDASERRELCAHRLRFRVRYSETDQMGTFYNSRPLEWFEMGRSELLRHWGMSYAALEQRGIFLPLVESFVQYLGRARYDDLLEMTSTLSAFGRARWRCDVAICHAETHAAVVRGYTVHAFTDATGKPVRPPAWVRAHYTAPAVADSLSALTSATPKPEP